MLFPTPSGSDDPKKTPEAQQRKTDRLADQKDLTGRIGETTRFIGFGLAAVFFAINTSDKTLPDFIVKNYPMWLSFTGGLGVLAILSDYLQYLSGYYSARHSIYDNVDPPYAVDHEHWATKWRKAFFEAKQYFAFGGAVSLIALLITSISRLPAPTS